MDEQTQPETVFDLGKVSDICGALPDRKRIDSSSFVLTSCERCDHPPGARIEHAGWELGAGWVTYPAYYLSRKKLKGVRAKQRIASQTQPVHHPAHAAHARGGMGGIGTEKYGLVFTGI